MSNPVAIIDYGVGNLRSVANAFASIGCEAKVISKPEDLSAAERIVLPGVGAFGDCMVSLRKAGWIEVLEQEVRDKGKPFLGLCVGMQMLATTGKEQGTHEGLNWVPGVVERIRSLDATVRVPHIGWNDVRLTGKDGLYKGLGDTQTFYFVHSYVFHPDDPGIASGFCSYGEEFVASIEMGNIYATQFHPEKSQKSGLAVLKNFLTKQA
jgi:glutamine amidotransferase